MSFVDQIVGDSSFSSLHNPSSTVATAAQLQFCCFGHAGDGNLHLNVIAYAEEITATTKDLESNVQLSPSDVLKAAKASLDLAVCKVVLSHKGSISAEHGVGQQKQALMSLFRSPEVWNSYFAFLTNQFTL